MVTRLTTASVFFLACSLSAATYHVDPAGNDTTGTGAVGAPWLTIGKAASVVSAGDTVNVAAGTYAEYVTLSTSGTAANPIRWIGAGATSIVQPSVAAASGWVLAPEKDPLGNGLYRHSSLPFNPSVIIANGMLVMPYCDYSNGGMPDTDKAWLSSTYSPAGSPSDAIRSDPSWSYSFWSGVEAFWWQTNNVTYIRFADGSDPNSKSIRISHNNGSLSQSVHNKSGFLVTGGYNQIHGFAIQHAWSGVAIRPGAVGTVVSSNRIFAAYIPVAINSASNAILNNLISQNLYGPSGPTIPGAWRDNAASDNTPHNTYIFMKGQASALWSIDGPAILMNLGTPSSNGDSNVIAFNVLTNNSSGIQAAYAESGLARYVTVASNSLYNSSSVGLMLGNGNCTDNWRVHDNLFSNVNLPIRRQRMNKTYSNGNSNSRHYIYRNRGWNPGFQRGTAVYYHTESGHTFKPEDWFYQNSFEGYGYGISGILSADWTTANIGQKIRALNNVLTAGDTIRREELWATGSDEFGRFDCNRIRQWHSGSAPAWRGSGNLTNVNYEWGGSSPSSTLPDFLIDETSLCWNTGTNLSGLGLPDNRTLDAGSWDIGSHEFQSEDEVEPPETPPVALAWSFWPQGEDRPLSELGYVDFVIGRHSTNLSFVLSGTWSWTGDLVPGTHFTVARILNPTGETATQWHINAETIPGTGVVASYRITAIPDGVYTGPMIGILTIDPGSGYTVSGDPLIFSWVDAQQNPSTDRGPERPGQTIFSRPFP